MKVTVSLYGGLAKYARETESGNSAVEVEEQASVSDLLKLMGIPDDIIKIVVLNGNQVQDLDCRLQDGDTIEIFPPVGGG